MSGLAMQAEGLRIAGRTVPLPEGSACRLPSMSADAKSKPTCMVTML
jgi:hypothetical protein